MKRLRRLAISTAAAAAVVAGGSLAVVPTALALPRVTCEEKFERAVYYWHLGWQYYALGDFSSAARYWVLSDAYERAPC